MTRLGVLAAVLAALLAWGLWQRGGRIAAEGRAVMAERRVVALEAERGLARAAAAVHAAVVPRLAAIGEAARTDEDRARAAEGADAPASDYLRAVADGLR